MAEPLPAALKIPEVSRFINRANQLRSIKPAIAYWCEYHAVNQIVGKSLHTADEETFKYTTTLLERLEETKTERAHDDAIVDNVAGQAYVEQFAQQTFDRAERTLRANKVTRQTADTFDAAATFFDLTREWGTPEPEVLQKIKFAKWNAARILKAIREGQDPNESNPKPPAEQEEPEASPAALDPNDPDVRQLEGSAGRPVVVEDVSDAGEPSGPPRFVDEPPAADQGYFPAPPQSAPSPEPFVPSPMSQSPSVTGPTAPPPVDPSEQASTPYGGPPPQEPFHPGGGYPTSQFPLQQSPQIPTMPSPQFVGTPLAPYAGSDPSAPPSWSTTPSIPHPAMTNPPPAISQPHAYNYAATPPAFTPTSAPAPTHTPVPTPMPLPIGGFTPNQKEINQAQKHAKWAISALNFEDVPTAINELRSALAVLAGQ
ncbi:Vta1 like-domain-containing protein [Dactylonectria estremocensis]|uniref:Vta1 like-domain-containing protein n=1 Tax=Dactylonectria estremocensis TaxID=1079267 RepID=A0A9P9IIU3_9HYPO|nr:Vta1 like-domain-containing protein [Dactylonectria estremocensis]